MSDPLPNRTLSGAVFGKLRLHDRNDEIYDHAPYCTSTSTWHVFAFGDAQIFPKKTCDRMGLRSERRGNRAESYGDVVRQGRLPKTLAESDETVLIGNLSV